MPHTASRYQQDLGFTDGRIFAGAGDVVATSSGGSLTITRVAAGDYSIRAANSTTGNIAVNVSQAIMRRLGFFEDTQNAFGSTFGSGVGGFQAGLGTSGTGVPGSAAPQGRPDTISPQAGNQLITPRTGLKIKGYKLLGFDTIYTVTTNDATTLTSRVDSIQYLDNVAVPTATVVLASGNNGLTKTQRANAYVSNQLITSPQYTRLADQSLWVEIALVTPAGGTLDFRGFDLQLEYNYN